MISILSGFIISIHGFINMQVIMIKHAFLFPSGIEGTLIPIKTLPGSLGSPCRNILKRNETYQLRFEFP